MAGGLIDLVAYGVQDLYLTGDPQITFFKILYRRHTNFSIESIPQTFSSMANFGETVTCTLSRSGDLVGRIFLYVQIPAIPKFIDPETGSEDTIKKMAWTYNLGYALVTDVMVEIGGKLIDKQYGEWLYIWSEVNAKDKNGINKMVGNVPLMYDFTNGKPSYELYIPLEYWFSRNNGLSLPLIALASSEVKITVTFRRLEECYRIGPTYSITMADDIVPFSAGDYIQQTINNQTIYGYVIDYDFIQKKLYFNKIQSPLSPKKTFETPPLVGEIESSYRIYNSITKMYSYPAINAKEIQEHTALPQRPSFIKSFLYVNYIYLDNEERNRFSRTNLEYLIEQIQFNQDINIRSPNAKHKLSLNHPCKALYFVAQLDLMVGPNTMNDIFNYTTSPVRYRDGRFYGSDLVQRASLLVNGRDRFGERTVEYFNLIEPYEHHYRGPATGINVYSFALNPEDHQPSSALNMSEIEDAIMLIKLKNVVSQYNSARIRSYALSYNILRIYFHMGGLAFV